MLPSSNKPKILEPYYTNEDIAFLHDIVIQAENVLPNLSKRERLPTNALFQAYYEFLPKIGVDADHDSRYARILFKIGGLRGEGTLYEKFEAVLAKLGIEIEYDQAEEGDFDEGQSDGRRASIQSSDRADRTDYVEFERNGHGPRGRPRANSESSIWIANDSAYQKNGRTRSHSPAAKLASEPFDPRRERSLQLRKDRGEQPHEEEGPGLVKSNGHASKQHQERSLSRYDGQMGSRQTSSAPAEDASGLSSDEFADASNATTQSLDESDGKVSDVISLAPKRPPIPVLNPSTTVMELKSTLAYENHLKLLKRPLLRAWHTKFEEQRERYGGLLELAQEHDKDHLLRDTLDLWRHRLRERQHTERVRRYFRKTEKRVERCYEKQLLTLTFQKWSKRAAVQVARTNEARERVLKLRYFNMWSNVTTENEVKVERHVLDKFYGLWKDKHDVIVNNTETAVGLYEGNLIKRVLKNWLYGSIEKSVRGIWEMSQKDQILSLWLGKVRVLKENQVLACEKHEVGLVTTSLTIWREKTHASLEAAAQAKAFFDDHHGRNLLQESINIWCHRSRLEKEATAKDREWCLKETLTALRMALLSRRTKKRLARHALHQWQLAVRLKVAKRVLEDRRKHQVLQLMQDKRNLGLQIDSDMETRAQNFRDRILQASAIRIWHQRMEMEQQRETTALNHHASHIAFNALNSWFKKHEKVQSMNRKAERVIYFFRGHKSMQRWSDATKASKVERGRAAYAQVRRSVKTRMVRDVIVKWRSKTQQVQRNQERAKEFDQYKIVVFSMEVFDKWRARTEDVGQMLMQAQTKSNELLMKKPLRIWRAQAMANASSKKKLLSTQLSKWRLRLEAHELNEARARDFLNNHTAIICSRYLNKWSNDAFQIRIQVRTEQRVLELKAEEYLDRCNRKHFRKFFKYWRIQMLDKRGIDTNQLRQVSRIASTPAAKRSALGFTARNEEWSTFDEGFDVQDLSRQLGAAGASTPTPSRRLNLSQSLVKASVVATPLRASALNKSVSKVSFTPGTPLATPLERRLRKGLFPTTPRTQPAARSALGRSVFTRGFSDITEVSKEDTEDGTEE